TVAINGSFSSSVDWAMAAVEIKPQTTIAKHGEAASNESATAPADFQLELNYPNPFNPSTNIRFGLPHESHVTIKIYSIDGRELKALVDGSYPAGTHTAVLHVGNLPSGTYFYVLQAGTVRKVRQLMLVK
ncbi:MAG: T9SS type A sorting domain-containing protein, partial [bacterium]